MQNVSPLPAKHLSLWFLTVTLLAIILLPSGRRDGFVYAAEVKKPRPHFSIQPSFSGPHAANPRGYFIYDARPGARIYDSIYVTNDGAVRGKVSFYPADAYTSEASGTSFRKRTDPHHDVGSWIRIQEQEITLEPGQSQEVAFTMTVPAQVRPGQHGGGIVAQDMTPVVHSDSQKENKVMLGIQTLTILGVLVNLPGKTSEKLTASTVTYDQLATYQRLLLKLTNAGTQLLRPSGTLEIKDPRGKRIQNLKLKLDTFLPQSTINYPTYIEHKALTQGTTYTAHLHLNYGTKQTLNYTTTFMVPLPDRGPLENTVRDLVANPAESGNPFSHLTVWHYITAITLLFLLISALFFWSQKLSTLLKRRTRDN